MSLYITTPIYYVNDAPHIGHAYTTIIADVLKRYRVLFGDEGYMLTGTDEHGQKVQAAAEARELEPQAHCDELVVRFQEIWKELNIDNDIFMRTTYPYHEKVVQDCLQKLFDKGQIYKKEYEGWYSVSEEIFYTEKDLVDGKSPEGKEVQKVTEANYFFKMSEYQERLIEYVNANPEFVQPAGKKSEVLGFLKKPLNDLCISRPKSRLSWGVELPFDTDFVTYVWFDALLNYATAIGYGQGKEREEEFNTWWPHTVHLIGKDILMTHAIYWPTMLMALDIPLPKTIFAHGWWLTDNNQKMSKSEGTVVDPFSMREQIGVDAMRYYFVRDVQLGSDATYSEETVKNRINSELSNNLGNLFSRTLNLIVKFHDGVIPEATQEKETTKELVVLAQATAQKVKEQIYNFKPQSALEEVITLLNATNKYIDAEEPWKAGKLDPKATSECLVTACEVVRIASTLFSPVMPTKSQQLLDALGITEEPTKALSLPWGACSGNAIEKPTPLFPRIA